MNSSEDPEILLVEDNPNDAELTLRALKKQSVVERIFVAKDGAEALDFLFAGGVYQSRKVENRPKVVFLDLNLPKVDGIEVLKRIKSDPRTRDIPVVMFTSSNDERDIVETYRFGASSYIVKPVDYNQFALAVSEMSLYWSTLNRLPYQSI